jgi:hypothetical protein
MMTSSFQPVKVLLPGEEFRWDDFVDIHKFGTIYHTSYWKKIIEDSYGHFPIYLYQEDEYGDIKCGLPLVEIRSIITGNRLVCLPCLQECNPLVNDQSELDLLIGYAKKLQIQRNCRYIEVRISEGFPFELTGFNPSIDKYFKYILDLGPDFVDIERNFHKNIKRDLKKISQNGLILEDDTSDKAVNKFYKLYAKMRLEKRLLPQPFRFFANMWKNLAPVGRAKILHAIYDGKVISSIFLLNYKYIVTYEYGASLSDDIHLHPSHFLLRRAIENAKSDNYKEFDFGRTDSTNVGLAIFKQRWGTKFRKLTYFQSGVDENSHTFREEGFYKKLMYFSIGKLPQWAIHLCGRILYRHFV